jgi:hypothetical protein
MRVLLPSNFDELLRLLTVLGALLSFLWGIWVWQDNSNKRISEQRVESERVAEIRKIESTKPFLERQLKLYTEATQVAATIATTLDSGKRKAAYERFLELYTGELAMVENPHVAAAMVAMRRAIESSADNQTLESFSLALAHACRESLDRSWGINAWKTPDDAMKK